MNSINTLTECIKDRQFRGTMFFSTPSDAEFNLMMNNLDIVFINYESGSFGISDVINLCKCIRNKGKNSIVRIKLNDFENEIRLFKASGADGVLLPATEDYDVMKSAAELCSSLEAILFYQIAHSGTVEKLQKLLEYDNCAPFIGPVAISKNYKCGYKLSDSSYRNVVTKIIDIGKLNNKAIGVHSSESKEELEEYSNLGVNVLIWGNEEMVLKSCMERSNI